MAGVTSDNLNLDTLTEVRPGYREMTAQEVINDMAASAHRLKAARYAMHKVRLFHYQTMMKQGVMQPDIAKQFYLAAMQNYDDMMKGSANGCFSDAIDREMAAFDINEAFSG